MELRHLRYFVAVAQEMNIHRAAERLNISQPPLSVTIQQLEAELGVALFNREGRGIQITRAGSNFLSKARDILANVEDACHHVQEIESGIVGTLRVGFISSAVTGLLQNVVMAHRKAHPKVTLELEQSVGSRIEQQVRDKKIDIGFVRYPVSIASDLNVLKVSTESWYAALPQDHALSKKKQLSIEDLHEQAMIFYPRWNAPEGYDDLIRRLDEANVKPNIILETSQQMTIAGLVGSGMAMALVPQCMFNIKVPNVIHRPVLGMEECTGFCIVTRKEDDKLVAQMLDIIKGV